MPKARRKTNKRSMKSSTVAAEDVEKNIECDSIVENWLAGVKTERRLLERSFEIMRKQVLHNEQQILEALPKEILKMKISDFVALNVQSVEKLATTGDIKNDASEVPSEENVVGKADCFLAELNKANEKEDNAGEICATSSKRKAPPKVRKTKKAVKGLALKTPLQKNAQLHQATPFFTPMLKTRQNDPKGLLPRPATEQEMENFEAKIQLVSATGSPITVPLSDERVRSRIQAAIRANNKLVKAELCTYNK